jgi:aminotransferase in exopolysaccharide biosynthesis
LNYQEIISFIRETFSEKEAQILLHKPVFSGKETDYVLKTLESTIVSSVGEFVNRSENMMSEIAGTAKAVAVVNGTSGLHLALKLVGVNHGDEVITQALTFVATANAISYTGAEPVFVDVDYDTMGLSPNALQAFLEVFGEKRESGTFNKKTGKKIAACVPMHTFGFPVRIEEIVAICRTWNIPVVEDAAESLGSLVKDKHTGSFGDIGVFSFNGNKIVTAGGGGMLVTNNIDLGNKAKHLSTTAKTPHAFEYFHDEVGYNYRMPNLNAALLCGQLEKLDFFLENKRELANQYQEFFHGSGIQFRSELPDTRANYWLMCIELDGKKDRDDFLKLTNENSVMTRPIWTLMHKLPMFQHCYRDEQRHAEKLEERIVNLPSSVRL